MYTGKEKAKTGVSVMRWNTDEWTAERKEGFQRSTAMSGWSNINKRCTLLFESRWRRLDFAQIIRNVRQVVSQETQARGREKHFCKNVWKFSIIACVFKCISTNPLGFDNIFFFNERSIPTSSRELCISEVCMNAAWRRLWWWLITLSGNRSGSGRNRGDPRDFFFIPKPVKYDPQTSENRGGTRSSSS